jgi:hypothetical protein
LRLDTLLILGAAKDRLGELTVGLFADQQSLALSHHNPANNSKDEPDHNGRDPIGGRKIEARGEKRAGDRDRDAHEPCSIFRDDDEARRVFARLNRLPIAEVALGDAKCFEGDHKRDAVGKASAASTA